MILKNIRAPLLYHQVLCIISNPLVNSNWSYSLETPNSGQNRQPFVLCDLEILWMTLKNNRVTLLYYIKLCTSFQGHGWIQTGVTVWKRSIQVKIGDFFVPCDIEIWRMTLKNNRATLLCYFNLCVSFCRHWWIQTGVTVRKRTIWVKINDFFCPPIMQILQTWSQRAWYFSQNCGNSLDPICRRQFFWNLLTAIAFDSVWRRQFFPKSTQT